jgi:hypothetical protein
MKYIVAYKQKHHLKRPHKEQRKRIKCITSSLQHGGVVNANKRVYPLNVLKEARNRHNDDLDGCLIYTFGLDKCTVRTFGKED